jgi:branched-chain amino acid transport system ATP-binding protein
MSTPEFLSIEDVSRHFGGHAAVDGVSLKITEGSLTGLIGPNGAGKTTLFNLVAGALPASRGRVWFRGQPVINAASACHMGLVRTFQNVRLFSDMTVLENVLTGMAPVDFWRGFLSPARAAERLHTKKAFYLLEDLGIAHLAGGMASEIPFGQQRLVEIARALALQPRLLLLDEPAAGLNRTECLALAALIRRTHDRGIGILLIEHNMTLVMNLVERILVLDRGRLIFDGPPAQAQVDAGVCAAYLGDSPAGSRGPRVMPN